jgi:hypothetical protein
MKAEYKGTIQEVSKSPDNVRFKLTFEGSIADFNGEAKRTTMDVVLNVKPVVGDKLKIGSTFTLILSDDESDAGEV